MSPRLPFALPLVALACSSGPNPELTRPDASASSPPKVEEASSPASSASSEPLRVAITFDDLPIHGPLVAGQSREDIHRSILETLARHRVPGVVGFVNAQPMEGDPDSVVALEQWLAAGHALANHTYSHPHAARIPVEDYIADIERNEALLRELHGPETEASAWKQFRYPYLAQGGTAARRQQIRDWLFEHDYQIVHASIDFADYAWNEAYARCAAREPRPEPAIDGLKAGYLDFALAGLRWSDQSAQAHFGRRIPQILLLHVGTFNTVVFDAMLTAFAKEGVEFVSVAQALEDEAYARDFPLETEWDGTIIDQFIEHEHAAHPRWPVRPESLLSAVCR